MAALAATVSTSGRPAWRVRIIGLAATGLLLVDPLLVHSVGFRLSMAACAAIVLLAPPISSVLPGPAAIRDALGVTLAAQLGVAPVLLATFGPMQIGRAHVRTPVTNAHLVCRLLLEKKKKTTTT